MLALLRPGVPAGAALLGVSLSVGCAVQRTTPSAMAGAGRPGPEPNEAAAAYAGDRACRACHAREFRTHSRSNHARTLRRMRNDRLPDGFPSEAHFTDPDTGARYTVREAQGAYSLAVLSDRGEERRTADLALGSGKRGMTFLSVDGDQGFVELRLSCFPRRHQWFITPGQAGPQTPPLGVPHRDADARRCIGCHATALPASGAPLPEERFMGVGCEVCHGPGAAHAAAAQAGGKAQIHSLRDLGAREINELCGKCHRTERDINVEDGVSVTMTQRFQPYGLMKSECFLQSGDSLSCVTCHNPHENVGTRAAPYERVCLSCHAGRKRQAACPINPRSGCVSCHMPQREIIPGISMADHYIRAARPARMNRIR